MIRTLVALALVAMIAGGAYLALGPSSDTSAGSGGPAPQEGAALVEVILPEALSGQAQIGQRVFEAACAQCHGENGAGRDGSGPPLVHRIYEPSHHGDAAFSLAVANGVRSHHWPYGNMPPVAGLTNADVAAIVRYIRDLQQANGIF